MADKIIKSGWLVKEGNGIKTWKKRWFTLKAGHLYYSKNEKKHAKGEDQGVINLEDVTNVKATANRPKKQYCFEIPTTDRIFYVCAGSDKEMQEWIEACREAKKKVQQPPTPTTAKKEVSGGESNGTTQPQQETKKRIGIEDFELLTIIGEGSFGKVLRVKKIEDGKIYAMKVLDKNMIIKREELEHTLAEKSILQKLDCPFLVKLHYTFQTSTKLYFILDFVNGGELFFHLQQQKKFEPERVRFYCAEIVLGIKYLHEKGVLYRDLKPENILITNEGHICMTDFGISKEGMTEEQRTGTFCGTPEYLAPEVLEGKEYGKAVDWWAFGTVMYEMLAGLPPFYSQDVQVMYQKILTAKLTFPDTMPSEAASLLKQLLEKDPEKRLQDPKEIMSHPYFSSIDWVKLNAKQITPPYIPQVSSPTSVENIDKNFTEQEVTIEEEGSIDNHEQKVFEGFTWKEQNSHLN